MLRYWYTKYIILSGMYFASLQTGNGQNTIAQLLEKADEELTLMNYPRALELYQNAYTEGNKSEAALGIGICLYNLPGKKADSEKYFEEALNNGQGESRFYLATIFHLQKKFEEAIKYYLDYLKGNDNSFDWKYVNHLMNKSILARQYINNPGNWMIENPGGPLNTYFSEYLPLPGLNDSTLLFTSRRSTTDTDKKDPYGEPFEDIYSISFNPKNNLFYQPAKLDEKINTALHDAAVSMITYGNELIIYRTNPDLKSGSLWLTGRTEKGWKDLLLFGENINTKNSWVSNACFGPGMQMIIFSSNREGGFGGNDLYRSVLLPGQQWSLPVNLGPAINTEFDETSPHFSPDGKYLYFSSRGHNNIGGYDIFRSARETDGSFSIPENLGYPVNSVDDDLHFVIDPVNGDAWFSSVRDDGLGGFDIYSIRKFLDVNSDFVIVSGRVMMSDSLVANKVQITVIDDDAHTVQGIYRPSVSSGRYILALTPGRKYRIVVEAENALPDIKDFVAMEEAAIDFILKRGE